MWCNCCWSKRDFLLFFAGFEAFHTIAHIILYFTATFPVKFLMEFTTQTNMIAIAVNAILTIVLLWLACKANTSCKPNGQNGKCC